MKIKDVITATKLTDRAVRLYMEEGLLAPEVKESYSGRRSIEFSTEDVEKLKRISLLRRAGFSISQIKALCEGGDPASDAFREFMDDKIRQHELDGKVIESLSVIDAEAGVTLEDVASRLTDEMLEGNRNEDLKPDMGKSWVNFVCLLVSLVAGGIALYEIVAAAAFSAEYRFPAIGTLAVSYGIRFVFPIIILLLIGVLMFFRMKKYHRESGRAARVTVTAVLSIVLVFHIVISPIYMMFFSLGEIFSSRTDDPDNYMIFDDWVSLTLRDDIAAVFPAMIPREAVYNLNGSLEYTDTTEYLYCHNSDMFSATIDVYAQWHISSDGLEKELKRIKEEFPDISWVPKGDFVCAYIPLGDNCKAMFAYHDAKWEDVVRYGFFWADYDADAATPYYETVDWMWMSKIPFAVSRK